MLFYFNLIQTVDTSQVQWNGADWLKKGQKCLLQYLLHVQHLRCQKKKVEEIEPWSCRKVLSAAEFFFLPINNCLFVLQLFCPNWRESQLWFPAKVWEKLLEMSEKRQNVSDVGLSKVSAHLSKWKKKEKKSLKLWKTKTTRDENPWYKLIGLIKF